MDGMNLLFFCWDLEGSNGIEVFGMQNEILESGP